MWRSFAFNVKRYQAIDGERETLVCASLENTVREIIKSAGVQGGSSHSGRRSLATLMDKNNFDLQLIQRILGRDDEEMTLEYFRPRHEPHRRGIQNALEWCQAPGVFRHET